MYSSLFLSQSCFMFLKLWFPFLSLNFPYMFLSPFSLFIATHSSPLCFFYYSYLLSFSHSHSLKIIKTFNFHRILTLKLETLNNYLFKKLNEKKKPSGYFNFIDIKTLFYYIIFLNIAWNFIRYRFVTVWRLEDCLWKSCSLIFFKTHDKAINLLHDWIGVENNWISDSFVN